MTIKEKSVAFLTLASAGKVDEAFQSFIHPQFIHHNPYFDGDQQSFRQAMADHARQFPDKSYDVLRVLEDGALTTVHGKVVFGDSIYSVIHIFRFQDGLIAEAWEASQELVKESPNQHGLF